MMRLTPRTVTFRIATAYAILSSAVAGGVFVLVYFTLATDLMHRTDDELLKMVKELKLIHKTTGRQGAYAELEILENTEGANRMFARVLAADSTVIATSQMRAWEGVDMGGRLVHDLAPNVPRFQTLTIPNRYHKLRSVYLKTANGIVYQVGYTLRDDDEILEDFRQVFSQAFVLMMICGGIVGWFLSRRAMSGVDRVREAALSIGTGDFDRRVPLGNEGQEIVDLATAFNEMIEKIRVLIKDLKNVTDNIAHDLRSPITRMRGAAETTLTGEQDLADYQDLAGMVVEECDRLVSMINTMLEIAETDAGAGAIPSSPVDMRLIIREAYELFELVAEGKGLHLEIDCPETSLHVLGERARLQRAVSNLIDNAVKFTPEGGYIWLKAQVTPTRVMIIVSDTGPGLEPKDIERVFERFYRGDRSRSTPGNGLGLSLAKAVVKAHGGEISVQSTPGKGCAFTIDLPRCCAADHD